MAGAYNVIGLAACADGERSESIPFADGVYFTKLAIDEGRAGELLMFRLAESQMDVIVRENVANMIGAKGFRGLELTPLE